MSAISKQALAVDNNQSFPTNNAGAITPTILRNFNTNMIDSNVNQTEYNTLLIISIIFVSLFGLFVAMYWGKMKRLSD